MNAEQKIINKYLDMVEGIIYNNPEWEKVLQREEFEEYCAAAIYAAKNWNRTRHMVQVVESMLDGIGYGALIDLKLDVTDVHNYR